MFSLHLHIVQSWVCVVEFQEWMPLYWLEYHCSELFNGLSRYTFTSKFDHPNNLGPITILTYKLNQQPTTASKSSLFLDACNLQILSSSVMNTNAIKNSYQCLFPWYMILSYQQVYFFWHSTQSLESYFTCNHYTNTFTETHRSWGHANINPIRKMWQETCQSQGRDKSVFSALNSRFIGP